MSEFFKAELKDKFLSYASDRDDYFQMQLLYDEYLRPNYSVEYVEKLILEIIDHDPDLLDIMSGNGVKIFMLSSTAYTEDFLENGGFKDIYIKEEEKWDAFLEQLSSGKKLSTEEKSDLAKTEKSPHKRERTLLLLLIAAVSVSFLFTLFSLVKDIFYKEEYVTKHELQQALEGMKPKNEAADSFLQLQKDSAEISDLKSTTRQDSLWNDQSGSVDQKP